MADVEFGAATARGTSDTFGLTGKIINWVGAFSSLALVIGLAFWGYDLTVRDVSQVPVVRALEGPARVQPDDPGGVLNAHQGLAVNSVQSEGTAEGTARQVVLAPAPMDLHAEDMILVSQESTTPVARPETRVMVSEDEIRANAMALAEQLAALSEPLDDVAVDEGVELALATLPKTVPGVKRSPRPDIRPKVTRVSFAGDDAVSAALAQAMGGSAQSNGIAPGTQLVQLGAFDDRKTAEAEWSRIVSEFGDYMGGKERIIQKTQRGGYNFYRLRASGFDDISAAARFCSVLITEDTDCIAVTAR